MLPVRFLFCLSAVAHQQATAFQMTAGTILKRKEHTLGWLWQIARKDVSMVAEDIQTLTVSK